MNLIEFKLSVACVRSHHLRTELRLLNFYPFFFKFYTFSFCFFPRVYRFQVIVYSKDGSVILRAERPDYVFNKSTDMTLVKSTEQTAPTGSFIGSRFHRFYLEGFKLCSDISYSFATCKTGTLLFFCQQYYVRMTEY